MLVAMRLSALLFLAVFLVPALAAEPRAVPTFESIGVYWTPPRDPGPGGCAIRFRKSGESAWREGLPLWFDARNAECRGSLVQLEPGTRYEIQLSGNEIQLSGAQLTAQTWSEQFPIARTVRVKETKALAITDGGSATGYVLYDGSGTIIDGADSEQHNITIA